jgi:hypothetical protein
VRALRDVYQPYDSGIPQYRRGVWRRAFTTDTAQTWFKALPPTPQPPPAGAVAGSPSAGTGGQLPPLIGASASGAHPAHSMESVAEYLPEKGYEYGSEVGNPLYTQFFGPEHLADSSPAPWLTASDIWRRVLSRSYIATLPEPELAKAKAGVQAVLAQAAPLFKAPSGGQAESVAAGSGGPCTEGEGLTVPGVPAGAVIQLPTIVELTWCARNDRSMSHP